MLHRYARWTPAALGVLFVLAAAGFAATVG